MADLDRNLIDKDDLKRLLELLKPLMDSKVGQNDLKPQKATGSKLYLENTVYGGIKLNTIHGRSYKWNQICKSDRTGATLKGLTYTNNGDGSFTISGTVDGSDNYSYNVSKDAGQQTEALTGHKIFIKDFGLSYVQLIAVHMTKSGAEEGCGTEILGDRIITVGDFNSGINWFRIQVLNSISTVNATVRPQVYDLTEIFGKGNEPETVEEFYEWLESANIILDTYYPYNTYDIKSAGETGYYVGKLADSFIPCKKDDVIKIFYTGSGQWTYASGGIYDSTGSIVQAIASMSIDPMNSISITVEKDSSYAYISEVDVTDNNFAITVNDQYVIPVNCKNNKREINVYLPIGKEPLRSVSDSVYDSIFNVDNTYKRITNVNKSENLGSLRWSMNSSDKAIFYAGLETNTITAPNKFYDVLLSGYSRNDSGVGKMEDRTCFLRCTSAGTVKNLYIKDSRFTGDATTFANAINNCFAYYETSFPSIDNLENQSSFYDLVSLDDYTEIESSDKLAVLDIDYGTQYTVSSILANTNKLYNIGGNPSPSPIDVLHNYSTEEQIVGTWIDGKTVYERVLVANNITLGTSSVFPYGTSTSNIDSLVCVDMLLYHTDGLIYPIPRYDGTNAVYSIGWVFSADKKIAVKSYSTTTWINTRIQTVIRYTKK